MREKRNFIRIEAPIVVTYKSSGKIPITKKTITKDFSEGGIRFPIYERLSVGTALELWIETPFDTMPINAIGQIVWIRALSVEEGREIYDVGVRFTEMKLLDKKRMAQTTKHFLNTKKRPAVKT